MAAITVQELAQRIGQEHVSDWLEVTQDMINRFADATDDHQFIHVNPDMAKMTPFGGTIAHGFLTLSLMPMLVKQTGAPAIQDDVLLTMMIWSLDNDAKGEHSILAALYATLTANWIARSLPREVGPR